MSLPRWRVSRSNNSTFYEAKAKTVNSGIQSKETNFIESTTTAQAVFTLGLDYDQIIIELNMKWVHINRGIQSKETNFIESTTTAQAVFTLGLDYDQIIIELNMKWVHINYLQSLIIIGLQLLQTTPLGLFEVITVRD